MCECVWQHAVGFMHKHKYIMQYMYSDRAIHMNAVQLSTLASLANIRSVECKFCILQLHFTDTQSHSNGRRQNGPYSGT